MPDPTYTALTWDQVGERFYETGVDQGVLYVYDNNAYGAGVAWNGLTNVSEKPSGAEATALYADNIKYLNLISNEEFGSTIEAYTYPDEFAECDGSASIATGVSIGQQTRKMFGLSYRTKVGNDTTGNDYGYKYHLIYGCKAAPTEKGYATINDSPEAITFSWEISTTPIEVSGFKPTACIIIDSTKVNDSTKMTAFTNLIHGTTTGEGVTGNAATLPTIAQLLEIFGSDAETVVTPPANGGVTGTGTTGQG